MPAVFSLEERKRTSSYMKSILGTSFSPSYKGVYPLAHYSEHTLVGANLPLVCRLMTVDITVGLSA